MAAVTTATIVAGLISVGDKLLDKLPDYDDRKKEKYFELKKNYNAYKVRPVEQRVNSYLYQLLNELTETLNEMVGML